MKEKLKESLHPLYNKLIERINFKNDIYPFCVQWGNQFPAEPNNGIMFVGKATNGWVSPTREVDVIFGTCDKRIFARDDQMTWVSKLENNKDGYNTRSSAFWRIIKRVSQQQNRKEEWFAKIAWSNLYKVSLEKGNPPAKLKKQQESICREILEAEIRILKPKIVIFLTSGWEQNFLTHIIKDLSFEKLEVFSWGKKYSTRGFKVNDTFYITSSHPQGKNEDEHVNAINEIIRRLEAEENALA